MSEWRKDLLRSLVPANGPHYNLWAVPEYGDFMRDIFSDYWWRGRQLTTGADRPADVCRCRTELVDGGSQYGVAHVRDPRCTIHQPDLYKNPGAWIPADRLPDRPACSCRYVVARVDGAPGPWAMFEPFGRYPGRRWGTRCFQIDPRCVHHGDRICLHDWEQFWDGSLGYSATDRCMACGDYRPTPKGASAWVTLDDAERRGE